MRDFEDSTLWRISAFERMRLETGTSGFQRLAGPTLLPTTLLADLRRLHADAANDDALEVMAACLRHREAALLLLQVDQLVWPVTLFPQAMLAHAPRDLTQASDAGLASLKVLAAEPPGVKPPGHWMHERVGAADHYRPLQPLLWDLALRGPRRMLLSEIGGRAAYRFMPSRLEAAHMPASGALRSAMSRLQRESAPLRDIAGWPGMGVERASRLLNALYLAGALLVTRSHPAAREQGGLLRSLWRGRRGNQ